MLTSKCNADTSRHRWHTLQLVTDTAPKTQSNTSNAMVISLLKTVTAQKAISTYVNYRMPRTLMHESYAAVASTHASLGLNFTSNIVSTCAALPLNFTSRVFKSITMMHPSLKPQRATGEPGNRHMPTTPLLFGRRMLDCGCLHQHQTSSVI